MLMLLQQQVCFSFQYTSLIPSRRGNASGSGKTEWIIILRTSLSKLPNTMRHLWGMWSKNIVPKIDVCSVLNRKAYQETITSPPHAYLDLVNHHINYMTSVAMMENFSCQNMLLKSQPDEAVVQYPYYLPHGSIWIHPLNNHRPGADVSISKWLPLRLYGDQVYILDTRFQGLVTSTRGSTLKVCWSR